jgi:hypothetical protein
MEVQGKMYSSYSFSTSALHGMWSVSSPCRALAPGKWPPGTHWIGSWVGPRAGLDTEVRRKILSPLPGIEPRSPGRPIRSQTLYWQSYMKQQLKSDEMDFREIWYVIVLVKFVGAYQIIFKKNRIKTGNFTRTQFCAPRSDQQWEISLLYWLIWITSLGLKVKFYQTRHISNVMRTFTAFF